MMKNQICLDFSILIFANILFSFVTCTNKWQARQDEEKTMASNGEFLEDEAKSLEEEAILSL